MRDRPLENIDKYKAIAENSSACKIVAPSSQADMPEISRFFGIVITMYYNDHPPPHFHVRYGQQKAIVDIQTLEILEGKLAVRVFGLGTGRKPSSRTSGKLGVSTTSKPT
jgi:Domain of unknown function (DUF4160)